MPSTQEIENLRTRFEQAKQDLHDAERDIADAKHELESIDIELRTLGFDPGGDLEKQLGEKEAEVDDILSTVEQQLAAASGRVPTESPQPD